MTEISGVNNITKAELATAIEVKTFAKDGSEQSVWVIKEDDGNSITKLTKEEYNIYKKMLGDDKELNKDEAAEKNEFVESIKKSLLGKEKPILDLFKKSFKRPGEPLFVKPLAPDLTKKIEEYSKEHPYEPDISEYTKNSSSHILPEPKPFPDPCDIWGADPTWDPLYP